MKNIILLKNFNNYFNRIIKYSREIDYYIENHDYHVIDSVNFRPMDGVTTTQVCTMPEDNYFVPDYLLVVDSISNGNQEFVILSRWFVMEWEHISGSQYKAHLRNDVIADNYDVIKSAPVFVEKAMLSSRDPFIFNSEGMTYNEIKKEEILLKDKTNISWLVGYYDQNVKEIKTVDTVYSAIEGTGDFITDEDLPEGLAFGTPENLGPVNYVYKMLIKLEKGVVGPMGNLIPSYGWMRIFNTLNAINYEVDVLNNPPSKNYVSSLKFKNYDEALNEAYKYSIDPSNDTFIKSLVGSIASTPSDEERFKEIMSLDGVTYKDPQGDLYKIRVVVQRTGYNSTISKPSFFYERCKENTRFFKNNLSEDSGGVPPQVGFDLHYDEVSLTIVKTQLSETEYPAHVTLSDSRNHVNDAPYDIFCIPYNKSSNNIKASFTKNGTNYIEIRNEISLLIARAIASQLGGTGQANNTLIYDLQLLPYCPIKHIRDNVEIDNVTGEIKFNVAPTTGLIENKDYSIIKGRNESDVGLLFWATESSGEFNIPYIYDVPENAIDLKVENETNKLRLCSPNYAGIFEFSPAKNKGIKSINVDYTYKPFSPYIHMNPNFNGLYGKDFNDSRGLICGGDFSIGSTIDRFAQYELLNKNYSQMFDREIKNLEVNNKINLTSDIISSFYNSVGAAAAGAGAGFLLGGPVGSIAGGIGVGTGSAAGGAADIILGQQGFKESRSFKTDMFNYQLGNIKALPSSIAKTTAFTANNKVFPFIEVYDCTEEEKKALKDKIKYNGMTVMRIETLGNYMNNDGSFFKGQPIRLNDIVEDSHIAHEIYNELDKGVFF